MSRIINPDSLGKDRAQLTKGIALALRELSRQATAGDEARDLAAFIVLALRTIADGIDGSVSAWEKRGYWVKADRFRMEWAWASPLSTKLETAVTSDDWSSVATLAAQVAARVSRVQVAEHHRLGKPWQGAYARLGDQRSKKPDKT
jgi:hypothetical protein